MKKILIVNTRSSGRKLSGMVMWGAWAVASYFKATINGADVIFLDENNEDNFEEKFRDAVKDRDAVGFSITSMQIKYTLPLARWVKDNYPKVKLILGGIHTVLYPDQDYGKLFDQVITYDLPKTFFDYSLLPDKVKEVYRRKRAQVVTGFNCSYKCAFCVNSVRNCQYESVPVDKILAEIDYIVKEYNPRKIYFRDEDFFQDFEKGKAIVEHILRKDYKFIWEASCRVTHFRPGRLDDDFLPKVAKSGCYQFRFGVESGSQRVLNFLRKGQTVEQIKNAVRQCVKHDIMAVCSILIGIPTETAFEREETYQLITQISGYGKKVEILGPQIYRPYPGGALFEEAKQYGLLFPTNLEDWETYYDTNPLGDVFDESARYPWLSERENEELPFTWILVHYGLNYSKSDKLLKRLISRWFLWHWKKRWFGGADIKLLMWIRKKMVKSDLD